jgi:hypothetical protein
MTNFRACVLFALIFAVCYGGAAWWTATLPGPLPSWDFAFEQRVPFVPSLSILYLTITPVLLLAPFLLRERTPMFAFALSVQTIIAAILFSRFHSRMRGAPGSQPVDLPARRHDESRTTSSRRCTLRLRVRGVAYRRFGWTLWAVAVAVSAWLMWEHHLVEIVAGVAPR